MAAALPLLVHKPTEMPSHWVRRRILAATSSGNITFSSTLNNTQDLIINTAGTTTFAGVVGGVTPLNSITTDASGTTAINGGTVSTSGAAGMVFNDCSDA